MFKNGLVSQPRFCSERLIHNVRIGSQIIAWIRIRLTSDRPSRLLAARLRVSTSGQPTRLDLDEQHSFVAGACRLMMPRDRSFRRRSRAHVAVTRLVALGVVARPHDATKVSTMKQVADIFAAVINGRNWPRKSCFSERDDTNS